MKKLISVIMSVILIALSLCSGFTAFAAPMQEERESKELNSFINGITELVREYDADKEFTVPENDETAQIQLQPFSAENTTDNSEPKYNLQDFQTARLIVRASGNFDNFGALEDVDGFKDFHILQYESPEKAMAAYEQLQGEKNITEVTPDEVCTYCGYEGTPENPDIISKDEFLNDWSRDRTQSKRLQDYLAESDIAKNEIIVGVVDSGIDYNHEMFKNRVIRTYFNSSSFGNANDEMDSKTLYHGTTVSSVIVNNSPENVKVAAYKVDDQDDMTVTTICAGFLKAIEDNRDVISISLTSLSDESIITEVVLEAYSKNIPVFAAVGNAGKINTKAVPANVPECIAVSATDFNNTTTFMNNLTYNADISAPGVNIAVAIPGNRYARFSGTSYSTPYAAALGAILKWVTPEITVDEIDARLKETSFDAKRYNESPSSQGYYMDTYCSLYDGVGMIQFCNALGLEKFTVPEINLENKVYVGEQTCTITCTDENAVILYTTDGTYPDFENATVYTEPFQVAQRTRIRAVAYYPDGGYYSDETEATPRIQYTDSDDNFVIDKSGSITKYKGSISDLYVPETINGITVTGFSKGAFNTVIGLTLPETVTEIPSGVFSKNSTIEFVSGEGVVTVKSSAFSESNIMNVEFPAAKYIEGNAFYLASKFCSGDFSDVEIIEGDAFSYSRIISFFGPEVQTIEDGAFGQCSRLENVYFPQCTMIDIIWGINGLFESCARLINAEMPLITNLTYNAFNDTSISKADFPFIKIIEEKAFYSCTHLEYINMPSLLYIPKEAFYTYSALYESNIVKPRFFRLDSVTQIEQDAFGNYPTSRIEFSHLETAQSLPQTEGCIIAMPSTFGECTEETKGRNYKVYGTSGTYAEQWAKENDHEFINISQDTAILKDVPMEYTDKTQTLSPDVIGFNRTYQWYASDTPDNTAGTPIEGATDREFNPEDYPAAKYYYCVVTSTDVGYDTIEIRTGVTENMTLNPADYSKVEKAKSEIPEDLSVYTDKSVKALQDILDNIDYSLDETEQSRVDDYAKAIEEAINALKYKPADYTEYNKAVEKANALDRSLYQDLTALDEALKTDVSGKNITEQSVVDEQTKAIEEAINSLKYKPADYSKLNSALAQVPEDLSIYTDESVKQLNSVIESLNYDLNITEQDEADKQVETLLEAIGALEKRYILGDVNLDGEITILDAKWVLQNIVRLRSLDGLSLKAADMNQDGKITIFDARLILFAVTR